MASPKGKQPITEDTIELAADTLVGDIQSFLVDRFRSWESAFRYMTEDQQRSVIDDARRASENLVRRTVQIISSDGKESIPVQVEKVLNDGKMIKVSMEASKYDENRHVLFDAAGCAAFLTVADPSKYEGGEMPVPDPDQPELKEAAE